MAAGTRGAAAAAAAASERCHARLAAYQAKCALAGCAPDPSVATSVATGWAIVKASNEFSLLPLLLLARDERGVAAAAEAPAADADAFSDQLETLRIKRAGGGSHLADANARVVAELVSLCPNLKHLDLSAVGLSKFGATEIIRAVRSSKSLESLNISNNPGISPALEGGAMAEALRDNSKLALLDVTNDQLGFSTVNSIRKAMSESHCKCGTKFELHDEGNNVFEELLNALTHGVGSLFSIGGAWVLMYHAGAPHQTRRTYYACLAYSVSLVLLFVASTALHAAFMNKTASLVLGLLDHAAIYFLIAGTYTPFCLISLENHPLGDTLAIAQWLLALFGIIFCFLDERFTIPFKVPIELTLYLSMGWMMAFVWDDAVKHISEDAIHLLMVGGAFYTVGVLFFIMEKVHHPIGHAIWHCFVLAGAVAHYFSVLFFVVGIEEENAAEQCTHYVHTP